MSRSKRCPPVLGVGREPGIGGAPVTLLAAALPSATGVCVAPAGPSQIQFPQDLLTTLMTAFAVSLDLRMVFVCLRRKGCWQWPPITTEDWFEVRGIGGDDLRSFLRRARSLPGWRAGKKEEEAAACWCQLLPAVLPRDAANSGGVIYGAILCNARAMGSRRLFVVREDSRARRTRCAPRRELYTSTCYRGVCVASC